MTEMNTGPVSFEDVRQALGEVDPASTNAGALRRTLGRGSLSTIQKHLDTLRAQAVQPAAPEAGDVPKPPSELLSGLWASAWAQAQAMVQGALAAALAKCEALAQALGLAQADAVAAQQEADQARDDLLTVAARLDGLEGQHAQVLAAAQQVHQEREQALQKSVSAAQQEADQAVQALELANARHAADLAVLRGELDRQVSQLADLRAALQVRPTPAPLAAVVAADQRPDDRHPE